MGYKCLVCEYDNLFEPPYDKKGTGSYEICPCCGFQFGYDDFPNKEEQIELWREKWINAGCKWFSNSRKVDCKQIALNKLKSKLSEAEKSINDEGTISADDFEKELGILKNE